MAPADPTERQEDSAAAADARAGTIAHVRVVFPSARPARAIGVMGITVGRATGEADAEVAFEDARMSRRHARIDRETLGWRLVDQGSRNGGYVDGAPLPPHGSVTLRDGAVIRLGDSLLVFRDGPPPPDDDDPAAFPGQSPAAANIRERVRQLTTAQGHVLVLGETGTGKERVSRTIGGNGPFVPQNCAELTRDLARSDLFGHVRGSFSGAASTKAGLVEAATGGVLFLDEIGELPLDVQGDLLRFLEDGKYRPIGATELRHSSARIVAATNVDLDAACRGGEFRRDLLARLRASNTPLELPPLRDRKEDILAWADHFLREVGVATSARDRVWHPGAVECLLLYNWPDNLRELRGTIRGVIAANPEWPLNSGLLPEKIQAHRKKLRAPPTPEITLPHFAAPSPDPTRAQIVEALARTSGRIKRVSEQLGIDRRKLYRLCEQYGIDFGSYRPASPHRDDD